MGTGSRILLVRHGAGRGRDAPYLEPCLEFLARRRPALHARLHLHHTGKRPYGPAPALDDVAAVVFWLADPLEELYPECFAEAMRIADAAEARGLRIANHPRALAASTKSEQNRRWRAAGIPTPRMWRFADRDELEAVSREIPFPTVLRPDGLHGQIGTRWLRDRAALLAAATGNVALPGTLTEFVDVRATYRAAGRRSGHHAIWRRFHHKKRAFVFGDRVRTNHIFFSRHPIVGKHSSTFWEYEHLGRWPPWRKLPAWHACRACVRADHAHWRRREEASELLRHAARVLELDHVAFDYAAFPGGDLILWEANPYFALERWQEAMLPAWRRMSERTPSFYEAIGDQFERLLDGA
ncbi:MAG: hypothetical protein PVF43_09605 [Candidatus Eiseniibacteriota bacterium]|jgi:hypothetical protein